MRSSSVADSCWTAPRARTVISCGEHVTEALAGLEAGMVRRLAAVVAVLGIYIGTAAAQEENARAALQASLMAMGGDTLKTIHYSGAGWSSLIGQTYGLEEDWPHFEVSVYTRAIDYDARWSREDYTRRQGNYATLGRVPMPEQRIT